MSAICSVDAKKQIPKEHHFNSMASENFDERLYLPIAQIKTQFCKVFLDYLLLARTVVDKLDKVLRCK